MRRPPRRPTRKGRVSVGLATAVIGRAGQWLTKRSGNAGHWWAINESAAITRTPGVCVEAGPGRPSEQAWTGSDREFDSCTVLTGPQLRTNPRKRGVEIPDGQVEPPPAG